VTEIPLRWLQSYLEGRTQFINMGQHESHATEVDVGVPQGFGPLLFGLLQPNINIAEGTTTDIISKVCRNAISLASH